MRELKFRAWHETDKCWYNPLFIEMNLLGQAIIHHGLEQFEIIPASAIEQYTGLKDKNGKEIYEGDIVEEVIDTGDYDIDGTYRYKVVWDDDMLCWSLDPNSISIHKDLWECNQSLKVIDNIHENPELLGGGDNIAEIMEMKNDI